MRYFSSLLLMGALVGFGCSGRTSYPISATAEPSNSETTSTASGAAGVVADAFPVPIVQLHGNGAQIGAEHGKILSDSIHSLHEQYLKTWFGDAATHRKAIFGAVAFQPHLQTAHWEEIRALAEGSAEDTGEMLLANCFLDLVPMTACSTITLPASASPDGVARFGRDLDFPSFNIADKKSVLLIYHPEGKYAFAAVSWPGLVGVLSGMNEHGLTLACMEVTRPFAVPHAMPYALLYRCVLEQCKTVDEAVALLRKMPRQTANNLMIMDASGDRAVAEISAAEVRVRRAGADEALVSTNFQFKGRERGQSPACGRYDHLQQSSSQNYGKIGVGAIEKMLGEVAQKDFTLQSMVFEPANRVLYLAVGADAPNKSQFHRIELGPLFRN